jgi:hypothetical protein
LGASTGFLRLLYSKSFIMALTNINLKVPTASADCVRWISQQEPAVVAEALVLAELSFNAVRREISESETSRLLAAHREQVQDLQQQLQIEQDKAQQIAEELKMSGDAALAADRARHNATVEALQRQIQTTSEAHRITQRLVAEENSTLREQIQAMTSEAAKNLKSELHNLREAHETRLACSQEESKRVVDSLQQHVQDLISQLSEARVAQARALEESEVQVRERLEADHARQKDILRGEIASLTAELKNKQGCEALAREEAIRTHAAVHEMTLQQLREQLRTSESQRAKELEVRSDEFRVAPDDLDCFFGTRDLETPSPEDLVHIVAVSRPSSFHQDLLVADLSKG